jgi:hypothetical protein
MSEALSVRTVRAERVCPTCGASDWGTRNRCNPCRARASRTDWTRDLESARAKNNVRVRKWRAANPEKSRAQDRRKRYALTSAAYDALLRDQGGRCAICAAANPGCVDHCHATGRVRGLLCRSCNIGLGNFRDDVERLRAAARYLTAKETEE